MFFKIFIGLIVGVFLAASWVVSNPPINNSSLATLESSLAFKAK